MRKEAKLLLGKAIDSLVLSVEQFNRVTTTGRVEAVLILLDHSFEMVLKASIVHRGGSIREPGDPQTIGFDKCVRKALSDKTLRFLSDDQALTLQTINGLRDAAQHHLIDISEPQLYLHAQSGVTLFDDILQSVFNRPLIRELPARALPISTTPPLTIAMLFAQESAVIRELLRPGRRRHTEALARIRPLAILDATIRGEKLQPNESQLHAIGERLTGGKDWTQVFTGAAAIEFTTEPSDLHINLRLTKKEGVPVQLVPEGTPSAGVIGVKRVNELDYYNLSRDQLARTVGLTGPKTTAVIRICGIQESDEFYKQITVGKVRFDRYSQKAIGALKSALAARSIDDIWREYKQSQSGSSMRN